MMMNDSWKRFPCQPISRSKGGGLSIGATQVAKHIGARVIGATSAAKHGELRALGADHLIDYRTEDLKRGARHHGRTGGRARPRRRRRRLAQEGLSAAAPTGRLGVFGASSAATNRTGGKIGLVSMLANTPWFQFNPLSLMNANKGVSGVNLGHMWDEIDRMTGWVDQLMSLWEEGAIKPKVARIFRFQRALTWSSAPLSTATMMQGHHAVIIVQLNLSSNTILAVLTVLIQSREPGCLSTQGGSQHQSWVTRWGRQRRSKYPPAKPGALGFEPLKAAWTAAYAAPVPHSESHAAKECLTCEGPRKAQRPFSPRQPKEKDKGVASRSSFRANPAGSHGYCRKCQTATATPAKPGELPRY